MQHVDWLVLSLLGFCFASLGGFGNHLLNHFRGRTLEAYCRLRKNHHRFGVILDEHEDARTACNYLFILGGSSGLIAGGAWMSMRLQWTVPIEKGGNPVTVFQLISFGTLAAALLASLHSWIPKIVVRNSAAVLLFHSWWCWQTINFAFRPFRALEHLFLAVGHRLSDRRIEDRVEEESLEDEVRKLVITGERGGLVTRSMRDMITGVMNLDEGQVSQIMTPRSKLDAIDIGWSWEQLLEAVSQSGRTRMPVYEDTLDNIIGILFVKDLMIMMRDRNAPDDAAAILKILREPWLIPATRQVDELLKDFLLRRSHMAIVVDEFQQTLGVVTIEDALEEIVGEIADELDVDETLPMIVEDPDGGFSIAGVMEVAAVNRQLALELPESDDYETVGGLVVAQLGVIPKVGSKTKVGKFSFSVTQANARQVLRIRVAIQP
jgi:CBS domain containing-hemolysin-like protein